MAAGLFTSLFAATSTSSEPSSAQQGDAQHALTKRDVKLRRRLESHDPDQLMINAECSQTNSGASFANGMSYKQARQVADENMQLSSPPSSPPPTVPVTPQDALASPASPQATKMEPSTSGSAKLAMSDSPSSTPATHRDASKGRTTSTSTATAQRPSRRRMMPARLSQVSSLLAGSMLEEELLLLDPASSPSASTFPSYASGSNSTSTAPGPALFKGRNGAHPSQCTPPFTSSSVIVLTSDKQLLARAIFPDAPLSREASSSTDVQDKTRKNEAPLSSATSATPTKASEIAGVLKRPMSVPALSSLVSTLAIKRQQLIETPDFKPRDDTLYMPKTRGLRSEAAEDTSDSAYERRHRKPETAEKRQRKAEVDRLSRDRQKLLSRIEQLKTAEARLLQPIVVARDQVRAEASDVADQDTKPTETEAKPLHERVEDVRKELLADAYETLKRYDLLLSTSNDVKTASPGPSALSSKSETGWNKPGASSADDPAARSQSPRLKIRIKGGRATWETAESASPTPRQSPAPTDQPEVSRRVSSRQPKQRVESLPTPLTAAAVAAVDDRRKRRRRSDSHGVQESPSKRQSPAVHDQETPTTGRSDAGALSAESRPRRRGSPEVGGSYKAKSQSKHDGKASSERSSGRPKRAAAAAAAVASARQRQYAERSLSDFEYDDEDEVAEVDSAFEADAPSDSAEHPSSTRLTSHTLRRSSVKGRNSRSPSVSSSSSSISSIASSLGYMYPTIPETGSLKVSTSLAEIQATNPEAASSPVLHSEPHADPEELASRGDGARKRLKVVLSRSPSVASLGGDVKKRLAEALDSEDSAQDEEKREKGRAFGGALTESEAESILAAFLGTTPLGKNRTSALPKPTKSPVKASSAASSSTASKPSSVLVSASKSKTAQNSAIHSKRRSTRRDTTQSFGEKLPDLMTKTAPFDYTVMSYFRSIDRPGERVMSSERDEDEAEAE
ncbi:uncharacterized protein MEPE_06436 [Melanopsichium pennsylvanicum]|uniref:Proteophosphoglycan ppg4 n=2 Tax=Melanopsichium pennsylvanicum TaxID=63383 RepID=A0AAJ4XTJ6_9BASI|nr:hypothetical protein BN887_03442 [Melanopsichium pennsylvanicum 4]SNX87726.1 uncharacterized protein MEPE_06436 [Melanopsichium pennsylvanicum]